jgi:hypothetical protein
MTRQSLTLLSLLLFAVAAGAQTTIPVEVEVGYRWNDVSGNEDLYRTQINGRSGFVVRSLSFFTATNGFTDHVRVDANDLGVSPASSLRVETGKADLFKLRLGYRSFDTFSALPAFANPLLGQGITPGQHTFDRTRTMLDADLEIFPDRRITPFIGYSRGRYEGPGTTTYTLGGDDFLLDEDVDESEREIRAGAIFNIGKFYGSVTQGWRSLESDETLSLFADRGAGNNPGSVLGRPVGATLITRSGSTDVDTPFTTAFLTAEVLPRLKLTGSFIRFAAESDATDDEASTGTFVSFPLQRFFSGTNELTTSSAKNTTWRGNARAEITLTDRLDLLAGYRSEHREMSGEALIRTLFLGTTTFGGLDPRDITEVIAADSSLDRDVDTLEAALAARALGPFSVRVGFSQSKFDFTVDPDIEEIVVPGNQGGDFDRTVDTIDAIASITRSLFSVGVSYRHDDADDAVLRTDYLGRDRVRVRASIHTPANLFRVGLVAENLDQDNQEDGIGYDAEARQYTADAEVAVGPALRLRTAYSILRTDSTVVIRRPETFALDTSRHREDGNAFELGFGLDLAPFSVDAGASRFKNKGSIPFDVDRYRARIVYDFLAHAGVAAEWNHDNYAEQNAYGTYQSDRFGIFLRYRP